MNSLLLSVKAGSAEVYVGKISRLLSCDDDPLLGEARKLFSNAKRQREWAASRALVRAVKGRAIPITYDAGGRPCIEGGYISISHSGDYVAVALSGRGCVGVDVQVPHPHLLRLEPRICNSRERATLSPDPKVRAEQLLTVWSLKESYYKASTLEFFDVQGITVGNGQVEPPSVPPVGGRKPPPTPPVGEGLISDAHYSLFTVHYSLSEAQRGWVWRCGEFVLTLVEWR